MVTKMILIRSILLTASISVLFCSCEANLKKLLGHHHEDEEAKPRIFGLLSKPPVSHEGHKIHHGTAALSIEVSPFGIISGIIGHAKKVLHPLKHKDKIGQPMFEGVDGHYKPPGWKPDSGGYDHGEYNPHPARPARPGRPGRPRPGWKPPPPPPDTDYDYDLGGYKPKPGRPGHRPGRPGPHGTPIDYDDDSDLGGYKPKPPGRPSGWKPRPDRPADYDDDYPQKPGRPGWKPHPDDADYEEKPPKPYPVRPGSRPVKPGIPGPGCGYHGCRPVRPNPRPEPDDIPHKDHDKKPYPDADKFPDKGKLQQGDDRPSWDDLGEVDGSEHNGEGILQPRLKPKRQKRFVESKVYHVPLVFMSNARPYKVFVNGLELKSHSGKH